MNLKTVRFLVCVSYICLGAASARANPQDGIVAAGQANISSSGTTLTVNQSTSRAVIDWRSFDIAPDETTAFHQPSSSSVILNRVNAADPSQIAGTLTANGHVVIVNPNGVFFSKGSHVDVGALTATTANIGNKDFMAGRMNFSQPGNANAKIVNEGTITARDEGLVNLVAPDVENNGVISATLGKVNLESGETFTLDLANDGLLKVAVGKNSLPGQAVTNTGTISANGGQVNLTAAAVRSVVDSLITNTGVIEAQTLGNRQGSVTLYAEGSNAVAGNVAADKGQKQGQSTVVNSGTINVSGVNAGEKGGSASLLADSVWVEGGAVINASGKAGGGKIQVGGNYHGAGATPTSLNTYVAKNTTINADAVDKGDGGQVTVWADGSTNLYGDISAQGGAQSGNGGFVEVSGKNHLNYRGDVSTLAANGETGMLLLDPTDIVIMNGTGDGAADGTNTFKGNATVGTIAAVDAGPSTIFESELEGIAAATNISVTASNSITINDLTTDGNLNLKQTAGRSVSFSAGVGGFTMLNTANTITTAGGALNITTAAGGTATIGNLATAGGLITLNLGGASTVGGVISGTGTGLTKTGVGALTLSSANTYTGNTTLTAGSIIAGNDSAFGAGTLVFNAGTLQGNGTARIFANAVSLAANSTIGGASDITFNGTLTNTLAGNPILTVNNTGVTTFGNVALSNSATSRTVTIGGTGNTTVGGVVSNGGTAVASGLTKTGTGTLILSGANTFAGATTISAGILQAANAAAFGTGTLTLGGGTLQGDGTARTFANAVSIAASSTIAGISDLIFNGTLTNTLAGNPTLTVNNTGQTNFSTVALSNSATNRTVVISGTGATSISGAISNGGTAAASGLTKSGTGTLTLSGVNTYGGATTLTAGTLRVNNANALGAGTLSLGGGTLEIDSDSGLALGRNTTVTAATTILSDRVTPGAGVTNTLGTLTQGAFTLTTTAGANVTGGTEGLTFGATNFTGSPTFATGAGTQVTLGALTDGGVARTITKNGLGILGFGAAAASWATAADALTINNGTALMSANGVFGTNTNVTVNANNTGLTALLDLSGFNESIGTLTLGGVGGTTTSTSNVSTGAGTLTLGGNVTFTNTGNPLGSTISGNLDLGAATRTFTINDSTTAANDVTISANIAGAGVGLTKAGTGTLLLSGTNTFTGAATQTAGTLRVNNANALGAGTLSLGGGTLEIDSDSGLALGRNTTVTAATTILSDRVTPGAGVTNTLGTLTQGAFTLTTTAGANVTGGTEGLTFGATNFTGSPTFATGAGTQVTLGALTDGGVARTITKNGLGILGFGAAAASWATAADALTINNGTALMSANGVFGTNTNVTVNANNTGLTALLDLSGFNESIGTLTLGGVGGTTTSTSNVSTGAGTLTLGGNVTFTNTGNPLGSTISGNLDLGAATRTFTINDSTTAANDVTISANIAGAGVGLTKAGTGTLLLSGTNTFTGAATQTAGTLRVNNANALGAGTLSLGGGTLEIDSDSGLALGRNTTVTAATTILSDRVTPGAGVTNTLGTLTQGAFTLTTTAGANVTGGTEGLTFGATNFTGSPTFATGAGTQVTLGALTDGGVARTITKNGLGILGFGAAAASWATAADALTINNGTALMSANGVFGTNTNVTVNANNTGLTALLDLSGFNESIGTLTLGGVGGTTTSTSNVSTGAGTLTLGGNVTFTNTGNPLGSTISGNLDLGAATRTFTINDSTTAANDVTISANIAGAGVGLTKAGTGTLLLSGTNTFTGAATQTAGTLRVNNANALGAGTLSLGGGTLEIDSDSGLALGRNTTVTAATTILSDRVTPGAGVTNTLGTLTQGAFTLTTTAGANVTGGTEGLTFGATNFTGSPTFATGAGTQVTLGALTDGGVARTITKNGLGILGFGAAAASWATAADALTINNGTALMSANGVFGTNTNVTVNANNTGLTALLDLSGFNESIGTLTLGGVGGTTTSTSNVSTGAGTLTLGGNVTFTNTGNPLGSTISGNLDLGAATRTFTINDSTTAANDVTISANIAGAGVGLTKAGTGTLLLSGTDTYTGTTTVNAGTLALAGGSAIADTAAVTLANVAGAALDIRTNETIGALSGGGAAGGNITLGANDLKAGDATSTTYTGVISGGGGFFKEGSGTLTLSGSNAYNGATTVDAGTLKLGAADRISNASDLIVVPGATFNFNSFSETLNSLTGNGTVTLGTGNTLTTAGAQTYNGQVTGGVVTLVSMSGGAISATNATNDFTGNVTVSTAGAADLVDANALSLGAVSANTFTAFAKGGNLTLNGAITASATSGTPILLSASANFINNIGAGVLSTGAGGRWLVYSSSPLTDLRNGLTPSFKQYNTAFGGTILGAGNGAIYTVAPVITPGLTGPVSKTYDGTLAATLAGGNYTIGGAIDGDTVVLNNPLSGTYADANAGIGKTVNVSGLSIASTTNGAITVYGYQLGGGGNVSGAVGTITAAPLTVSTSDVIRSYDGTLTAAGTPVVTSGALFTNVSNGNTLDSLSGGAFAFTNANAGTNKTVTVGGITVNDGNGGNNYIVTQANNTTSTINAANITVSTGNVTRNYDGTLTAAGTPVVTSGALFTNVSNGNTLDSLSGGSFAFANANAGTNKTVTVGGVTVNDGNGGGNYAVTYASNNTSTINQAPLTISTSNVVRGYNGTLAAAGAPVVTSGTMFTNASNGGILDSLGGGTFTFTDANAGTNKTVTVGGVTVNDGNGGGNYAVTYASNNTSTINSAAITVSTSNVTKIFDGTTSAAGIPVVIAGTMYNNVSNGGLLDNLSGGVYAFLDPLIGTGKTVTVGGVTVNDGNGGGNYTVTYADNINSTILPVPSPQSPAQPTDFIPNVVNSIYQDVGTVYLDQTVAGAPADSLFDLPDCDRNNGCITPGH